MSTSDDMDGGDGGRNASVAEYVLGLLSPAEHDRVHRLIENDQALRAERDFWVTRFAALNEGYEEVPVPDRLWAGIEARALAMPIQRPNPASGRVCWSGDPSPRAPRRLQWLLSVSTCCSLAPMSQASPPNWSPRSRKRAAMSNSLRFMTAPAESG
ncbi:hypothetical protein N8D56_01365 [Devosia sp. A8/3-2]|nr:hypothetical protein N8D56_01365 [Devosia sp. A8/3-2]